MGSISDAELLILEQKLHSFQDVRQLRECLFEFIFKRTEAINAYLLAQEQNFEIISQQKKSHPARHESITLEQAELEVPEEVLWLFFQRGSQLTPFYNYEQIPELILEKHKYADFARFYGVNLLQIHQEQLLLLVELPQSANAPASCKGDSNLLNILHQTALAMQGFELKQKIFQQTFERDKKEGFLKDEISRQKVFIEHMNKLQQVNLKLSSCLDLDSLYLNAVTSIREELGFDRASLFLIDHSTQSMSGTYGTDTRGVTTDEYQANFKLSTLAPIFFEALSNPKQNLVILENAPLYTLKDIVGQGWNAMLILRDGEQAIGWLAIDNLINKAPLHEYQKKLLQHYGAALSQQLIRRRSESDLIFLNNAISEMSDASSVLDVCHIAVKLARTKMNLDRVAIMLSNSDNTKLTGTYGTDMTGKVVDESYYESAKPDTEIMRLATTSGKNYCFMDPAPLYQDAKIIGYGWNMVVCLRSKDAIMGYLFADNFTHRRVLNSGQKELIRLFGLNVAQMISKRRAEEQVIAFNIELEAKVAQRTYELETLNKKLETLSTEDPLTGLHNRRSFEQTLENEWSRMTRLKKPLCAIMLDVDFFKNYNDLYGHLSGDACLKDVADSLKKVCHRATDCCARFGGEEFIVLSPDTNAEQGQVMAKKIQQTIRDLKLPHKESKVKPYLTVSIGVAALTPTPEISTKQLIEQADKAMYKAKSAGRNQIVLAPSS
ncbi:sensor domain-containing diguanylate cyclase [Motilimonas sp. E26]|uniref:sensor domain-containing diguanylate cyclase n=1 Tax=Motilimonas sp. E26 TaxID=2865674 RepID=UPI001E422D7C|nr:sensor domain-containing diguanylate cyclase [Motilimonas sp. E26]MCE0559081.1 sensor domain-containing diguanylate cyclase [Motilimonas sp. E26]